MVKSKIKAIIVKCDCGNEVKLDKFGNTIDYFTEVKGYCNKCTIFYRVWADVYDIMDEVPLGVLK